MTFLPSDGLGIVVLINTDEKADDATKVTNRVIDTVLGLSGKDDLSSERYGFLVYKSVDDNNQIGFSSVKHLREPRNGTAIPHKMAKYAGIYHNPGYGSITLCDVSNSLNSSYCAKVIADFAAVDSQFPDERPRLLASWSRLWSSHVRIVLADQEGKKCRVEPTTLFPEGYGKDQTPFETFESSESVPPAEFVLENGRVVGVGVFGFPGDLTGRRPKTVQGQAEVWFDKVDESTG